MKLYEFAVILDERREKGKVAEPAEIVAGPEAVLARDDAQAQLLAARAIPEEFIDRIDRLTVVVRPF